MNLCSCKFIESRQCKLSKGHFPYTWLTSYDKLYENKLPNYECFDKNKTTQEEYNNLISIWNDKKMTSMFDYLEYYNN